MAGASGSYDASKHDRGGNAKNTGEWSTMAKADRTGLIDLVVRDTPTWVRLERDGAPDLVLGPYPSENAAVTAMEDSSLVQGLAEENCLDCYTSGGPTGDELEVTVDLDDPDDTGIEANDEEDRTEPAKSVREEEAEIATELRGLAETVRAGDPGSLFSASLASRYRDHADGLDRGSLDIEDLISSADQSAHTSLLWSQQGSADNADRYRARAYADLYSFFLIVEAEQSVPERMARVESEYAELAAKHQPPPVVKPPTVADRTSAGVRGFFKKAWQ